MSGAPCEYTRPNGEPCQNHAMWRCFYREPERPNTLRRRLLSRRCSSHAWNLKFFPAGSSQLDTMGIDVVTLELRELAEVPTEEAK